MASLKVLCFLVAVMVCACAYEGEPPVSSKIWELTPTGYYQIHEKPANWSMAWVTCRDEGGHLVVVDTPAEKTVLQELISRPSLSNTQYIYVGVHDLFLEGQFTTILGAPESTTAFTWAPNEPNEDIKRNCGCIDPHAILHMCLCDYSTAFVCEWAGPVYNHETNASLKLSA